MPGLQVKTQKEKFDAIAQAVADYYRIEKMLLFKKTKSPSISIPRQETMYIMREKGSFRWEFNRNNRVFYPGGLPTEVIGQYFGLSEACARRNIKLVENELQVNKETRNRIATIIKTLSFL